MPILNWIGKEKLVTHHQDIPFRVLDHQYTFNTEGQSKNKIIHGDNLEGLKALLPEYEGRIKCIYIDPPYNTGNETWIYNDNVNHPRIKEWLGKLVGKESEDLSRHDKWLCMMYPRLQLLHKLLSPDGAIFISIDDNELANLRLILDEIFGKNNFIDYFSWQKSETPANLSYKSKKAVEYVVAYQKSKTKERFRGLQKTSGSDNPLIKPDNSLKELYFKKEWVVTNFKKNISFPKGLYGTAGNAIELLDDITITDGRLNEDLRMKARFIWLQNKLEEEVNNGTEIRLKTKTLVPSYEKKSYEPEVPWNLINTSFGVGTTQEGGDILTTIFGKKVFDFPKPPSLIEYIINFLCDKDDIILDSFAGSGTTAHAVLNLNKKDNGNRAFILIEMEGYADSITAERVKRVVNGYSKEEGTGGDFSFYTLGEPLFTGEYADSLNENIATEKIEEYIWFAETRTALQRKEADAKHPYFLGRKDETAYYFIYNKEERTTLDYDLLPAIRTKAPQYIIYADNCLLSKDFMTKHNIFFKKVPKDITRF